MTGAVIGAASAGLLEGAGGLAGGLLGSGADDAASSLAESAVNDATDETSEAAAETADAGTESSGEDANARGSDDQEPSCQTGAAQVGGQSFTAGTKVLLANGNAVPISSLKPGEKVLATNTRTGKNQAETITAVLVHNDHDLYDLKVRADGRTTVIDTTSNHLFWDPYLHYWVPANKISKNEHLKAPDGAAVTVVGGTTPKVQDGWMWDLTVPGNNDHDFYVVGTVAAVLVHNSNCDIPWSSGSVSRASRALDEGSTSVSVGSRSEAEELFLGKYQRAGYRNATGFDGPGTRQYFGSKVGTYHWDDQLGEDGRVLGHGSGNSDGDFPHLQIHTLEGPIVRIFWSP
ncbi:MAG: Hint domain-containing protein [Actinomycetota bacterium]|nr:Hint domain-containing protein [Actinomycetota bacterium]